MVWDNEEMARTMFPKQCSAFWTATIRFHRWKPIQSDIDPAAVAPNLIEKKQCIGVKLRFISFTVTTIIDKTRIIFCLSWQLCTGKFFWVKDREKIILQHYLQFNGDEAIWGKISWIYRIARSVADLHQPSNFKSAEVVFYVLCACGDMCFPR